MIAVSATPAVPATAAGNRQPNGVLPNAITPRAIAHFPSCGCSQELSPQTPTQYFSVSPWMPHSDGVYPA